MSIQQLNSISNRLSLRPPQRESLEILARVGEITELTKDTDPVVALTAIKSEFPTVKDFERDFPSLCFAIATGVGKTRLMGAFIAYLYQAKGIRNFFVLAPNLTIYNKLIADFTPNTPKYVFKGIDDFAVRPPLVVTGDTYEDGRGVRVEGEIPGMNWGNDVHINIFNISKINSEVRGGNAPRIKRLSECIGQSYFEYLAGLDDLVMLMDESHRYRATAGVRAINELKPILGLELTATPQIETGTNATPFKNVIYSYPLSSAMADGFVKEPAVATRENFVVNAYDAEELEKIKLEDGVRIHENTKVELEVYARNNNRPVVKPFMLVVASDTTHANVLQQTIEGESFFEGQYKGKVIQVHSNIRGEEKDEVVQQLLTVEHADNPIEIVIHVNMLKEGWDVTNLYTIVPLRAANSRTLVEQSIGRGLRLPYGKRVGVPAVDRLTIVSHDKFQEIIDHANDPNSIIRAGVKIGRDIPDTSRKVVEVKSTFENVISGGAAPTQPGVAGQPTKVWPAIFDLPGTPDIARAFFNAIEEYECLPSSDQLLTAENQEQIVLTVQETIPPTPQGELPGIVEAVDMPKVMREFTKLYLEHSIDIPKIVIVPRGDVSCRYEDFDLDVSGINLQPVSQDILFQHLHENKQYRLSDKTNVQTVKRPEDHLVFSLIDSNDINYDDHAELLYKLSGQVVTQLRSYLQDEKDVINVLQFHQQTLAKLIYSQMQQHYVESATSYEAKVTRGFCILQAASFSIATNEKARNFRELIPDGMRNQITSMAFDGFAKCLYPMQKFDSDSERRLAILLEDDTEVLKWVKPTKNNFQIFVDNDTSYEPDFVVETSSIKYLCEPKRASEMTDELVLAKANAAATWCMHASKHAIENNGKPWQYLLIPHDQIQAQMTLAGLAARYQFSRLKIC